MLSALLNSIVLVEWESRTCENTSDLTLLDFADAARCSQRLPKNKLIDKNILLCDLDHTTDDFAVDLENTTAKIGNKQVDVEESNFVYSNFHIDIWFLISEWIAPEDVCRFALICQKTRHVVSTVKFWAHLYRRHYNSNEKLPECLQPENIGRTKGYRGRVIRSLFYMYPLFSIDRSCSSPEPNDLIKFKCIGCWFQREKSYWTLCYKFSRNPLTASQDEFEECVADSWEDADVTSPANSDIYYNREEGNRLLVVKTDRFHPPPSFLAPNLVLSKIIQPLSQNMRTFKLEMTFSEYNGRIAGSITYDPVRQWKILRWWEPEYYSYSV